MRFDGHRRKSKDASRSDAATGRRKAGRQAVRLPHNPRFPRNPRLERGEAYLRGLGEEFTGGFGTSSAWLTVPDAFTVTVGAGDVALSALLGFLSQLAIAAATRRQITSSLIFMGDCRLRIDYLRL
jgi:hypothetical protein